jgi:CDP-diacylglycerol pyrophosphatase
MDEEDRQERRGDRFRRLLADIADRLIEPVSKGQMYAFYLMAIVAVVIGIMVGVNVTKNAQEARRKTILENCEEQNNRNRNTLAEAETIPGDKHIIVALIDDLAPYHNCQEVLHKAGF